MDSTGALSRIAERYEAGYLSDEDYADELQHLLERYKRLRGEVVDIVNERGANVRSAFRPTQHR